MTEEIEFEQVITYINDMGSEDHLAMFLPEDRHEEFITLQIAFSEALRRFKETVKKWANESYKEGRVLEDITLLLKKGVRSPAVFLQEIERLTGISNKKEGSE